MKKIKVTLFSLIVTTLSFAQTNNMPASGPVYFGITSSNFVSEFNLQVHGVE